MPRARLPECDVESFRQRLCEIALQMFAEHGRDGVSLRALSKKMGCSHTTPYRYFNGVEEIFARVRCVCFSRFEEHLRRRLDHIEHPLEALRELGAAYFDFAKSHPAEFEVMFAMNQPDPSLYPDSIEAGARTWRVPLELAQRAVSQGYLCGEPEEIAHLLWSGSHGIAVLDLAGKFTLGKRPEELLRPQVEAVIAAYRKD